MRFLLPAAAVSIMFCLAGLARCDEAKSDQDAIQGTWQVAPPPGAEKAAELFLHFEKDQAWELKGSEKKDPAFFKLDATKTPREIDLVPQSGDAKGTTVKGIYEIKGDTLRICLGKGDIRPAEFKTGDKSVVLELTRRRAKP